MRRALLGVLLLVAAFAASFLGLTDLRPHTATPTNFHKGASWQRALPAHAPKRLRTQLTLRLPTPWVRPFLTPIPGDVRKFELELEPNAFPRISLEGPPNFTRGLTSATTSEGREAGFEARFWLDSVHFLSALVAHVRDADVIASMGSASWKGRSFERYLVTWDAQTPSRTIDQYIVWWDPERQEIARVDFTLREIHPLTHGSAEYLEWSEVEGYPVPTLWRAGMRTQSGELRVFQEFTMWDWRSS